MIDVAELVGAQPPQVEALDHGPLLTEVKVVPALVMLRVPAGLVTLGVLGEPPVKVKLTDCPSMTLAAGAHADTS